MGKRRRGTERHGPESGRPSVSHCGILLRRECGRRYGWFRSRAVILFVFQKDSLAPSGWTRRGHGNQCRKGLQSQDGKGRAAATKP